MKMYCSHSLVSLHLFGPLNQLLNFSTLSSKIWHCHAYIYTINIFDYIVIHPFHSCFVPKTFLLADRRTIQKPTITSNSYHTIVFITVYNIIIYNI
jgi:hypothetical protein